MPFEMIIRDKEVIGIDGAPMSSAVALIRISDSIKVVRAVTFTSPRTRRGDALDMIAYQSRRIRDFVREHQSPSLVLVYCEGYPAPGALSDPNAQSLEKMYAQLRSDIKSDLKLPYGVAGAHRIRKFVAGERWAKRFEVDSAVRDHTNSRYSNRHKIDAIAAAIYGGLETSLIGTAFELPLVSTGEMDILAHKFALERLRIKYSQHAVYDRRFEEFRDTYPIVEDTVVQGFLEL